jgi:hypothetical protein
MNEPSKRAMEIAQNTVSHYHYCGDPGEQCCCNAVVRIVRLAEAIDDIVTTSVKSSIDEERRRWMAILRHHHDPDDKPRPLWKWRLYIHQIELMGESGDWPTESDR